MLRLLAIGVLVLPILSLCIVGCPPGGHGVRYFVTDLGSFGGERSNALGVNDKGQVVGLSELPSAVAQGFVWDEASGIHSVGSLNEHSEAWDINESGQIVGETDTLGGALRPFLWIPDAPNGTTGTMLGVGTLGGEGGAWQINELGQITGWSDPASPGISHPFLWTPDEPNGAAGSLADLGTLGGAGAEAYAINDAGQTAGRSEILRSNSIRSFVWSPDTPNGDTGTMHDLDTLGGSDCAARGINASGEVVGWSSLMGDGAAHAFKWVPYGPNFATGGTMHDLGTLGGDSSFAHGINDRSEVVGRSKMPSGPDAAFLWTEESGMIDLNSRLETAYRYNRSTGKGWQISMARDINSKGWIVGTGTLDGGLPRAVLLRPIPGN